MLAAVGALVGLLRALGQPPRAIPLRGNATLGYYFATALVGSERQPQPLIVDTGSYITAFGCADCVGCGRHWQPLFDWRRSASFRNASAAEERLGWRCEAAAEGGCPFRQGYAEGSAYTGRYVEDRFVFENETLRDAPEFTLVFGCAESETEQFLAQEVNGVLGLGARPPYCGAPPTVVEAARLQNRAAVAQFSICLGHDGGRLRLGAVNAELRLPGARERIIRPKAQPWRVFYAVPLTGIAVGGQRLRWGFDRLAPATDQAFFDTGATLTYLPLELHGLWVAAFGTFCAAKAGRCGGTGEYRACYELPGPDRQAFLRSFPNVTFTFGDVDYAWMAQDYLVGEATQTCVGVQAARDLVLGASFMRNYDITFDLSTQTVGFVRADCAGTGEVWPVTDNPHAGAALPIALAGLFLILLLLR